jgi:hypothetical protein
VFGAGLTINFTSIESLRVDGAEGDDRFFVQSTSEKFVTELFGGLGEDTFNMSGDAPPVVSNDLLGHSGIITNDVTASSDLRYQDLTIYGVSANVADDDEPFVVIRSSGGSSIVSEGSPTAPAVIDSYEVVLTRAPLLGFDVFVKALAPLPTPDQRELGALAFRLSSPAPGKVAKADGSAVTLRFTASNWFVPQLVEIRADNVVQTDTGALFTRPELGQLATFTYQDAAFEGVQSTVINHLVVSAAATVEGQPLAVNASPTITIATTRPFYEFLGEDISVTKGGVTQARRIVDARLVGGNMQLSVDRSWLAGTGVPDGTSTFAIDLDGTLLTGPPVHHRGGGGVPTLPLHHGSLCAEVVFVRPDRRRRSGERHVRRHPQDRRPRRLRPVVGVSRSQHRRCSPAELVWRTRGSVLFTDDSRHSADASPATEHPQRRPDQPGLHPVSRSRQPRLLLRRIHAVLRARLYGRRYRYEFQQGCAERPAAHPRPRLARERRARRR